MNKHNIKLFLILLLISLALITNSYAIEESINNGENITFENEIFSLSASDDGEIIFLKSLNTNRNKIALRLNEKFIDEDIVFKYLKKELITDVDPSNNITANTKEVKDEYSFLISITKLTPKIQITKSISVNNLSINDHISISITIKNIGDVDISGTYSEKIPSIYLLDENLKYQINDEEIEKYSKKYVNEIKWDGTIKIDESITLIQELQLIKIEDESDNIDLNKGKFSYSYLGKDFINISSPVNPTYYYPLIFKIEFDKDTVKIGKLHNVTITLNNEKEDNIKIEKFIIQYSKNYSIREYTEFTIKNELLSWDGIIKPNKTYEFTIWFIPQITGNLSIVAEIESEYQEQKIKSTIRNDVISEIDKPIIDFYLPSTIPSNGNLIINYSFDNKETKYDYNNFNIEIKSELFENKYSFHPKIFKGDKLNENLNSSVPWTNVDKEFQIEFFYTYQSKYKEYFVGQINQSVTIKKYNFTPDMNILLTDFTLNETDNQTPKNELTFYFNITFLPSECINNITKSINSSKNNLSNKNSSDNNMSKNNISNECIINKRISDVLLIFNFLDKEFLITPTEEQLNIENNEYFKKFYIDKNISIDKKIIYINGTYLINEDMFYYTSQMVLDHEEIEKNLLIKTPTVTAKSTKPKKKEPAKVKEIDYLKGVDSGLEVEFKAIDTNLFLFAGIILMLIIFVIFGFILFMKNKKKISYAKHDSFFESLDEIKKNQNKKNTGTDTYNKRIEILTEEVPYPSSNLIILEDYINKHLKNGTSKNKIMENLLKVGWLKDIIEVYLK
ncbi:hypothetical protein HN415_06340 [Candidatus Woesearchaeota archaeon]|nr:hypothetical protein [Candidatus Woesearchaeota archaeon]